MNRQSGAAYECRRGRTAPNSIGGEAAKRVAQAAAHQAVEAEIYRQVALPTPPKRVLPARKTAKEEGTPACTPAAHGQPADGE